MKEGAVTVDATFSVTAAAPHDLSALLDDIDAYAAAHPNSLGPIEARKDETGQPSVATTHRDDVLFASPAQASASGCS